MRVTQLKSIIKKIFIKHKLSNEHANVCTNAIINAELVGASSHGVSRVKMYCDRIKKKLINPQPKIKFKKISNSIFHVDANNGMGFISADKAIKKAIYCAKKTGFSLVGIKNSSHYGLSGYYAEQAVKKKFNSFMFYQCSSCNCTIWF